MGKTQKIKFLISFVFAAVFFIALPVVASAATLYFSPSSGSHAVGATLSVSVYVSSADQAMNAASGVVSFPQDKLEVVSLSKTGSIFSLWVQEPSFSSTGTINFEGIALNPGFTGASGKLIAINFRVKTAGTALLNFSSGSVLANDGKGTNILANLGNAQFSLGGAAPTVPEATTPSAVSGAPFAPKISSPTHPDPNKWYAQKDAKFTWSIPSGVIGVRLLVGKIPSAAPTVVYAPVIGEKEIPGLADGVWYFHAQFRNAKGWGEISHFRFQIDTQPPEPFSIKFVHGKKIIDPSPIVAFNTTDELSGVNHYKIKIGSGDLFEVDPNLILSNPYALPPQNPGKNTIVVQAYDKAENAASAMEEFEILALESPKIIRYQEKIAEGDLLEIGGKTYPDSDVDLFLLQEGKKVLEQRARSNIIGDFTFILSKKLKSGVYDIQVQVIDNRGAKSLPSEKITIAVAKPKILQIGSWAINLLAVAVPLVALIFILLFIIWYGWHKFASFRKKLKNLRKEVREAESALHKAFDLLKEDIREQIKALEKTRTKRQLTEEEEKIVKRFKKDLDDAEEFVKKEIKDIEDELR